jgi:hypothetical protein
MALVSLNDTLLTNVLGSPVVGYVTWSADHEHDYWRLFAATGFCDAIRHLFRVRLWESCLLA